MANINAPFGLRPIRYMSGAPYNGACNEYFATGASGVIAIGDPVIQTSTSNTAEVQGRPIGSLPEVTVALGGAGNPITGVCVAVEPVDAGSAPYRLTSTDRIIKVADDPNLLFYAQTDATGTAFAATDVGAFANLIAGTASIYYNTSTWAINTTASATTVTWQVLLWRLAPLVGNAIGAYAVWEVAINNHALANVGDAGRFSVT